MSVHREVSASGSRGCLPLSLEPVPLGGSRGTSPPGHTHTPGVNMQSVRILLECFLVSALRYPTFVAILVHLSLR